MNVKSSSIVSHECFFVIIVSSPSYLTLSMGFTLAQTIESLKVGQFLNSLSFGWEIVDFKYQTPENCKFKLSTRALV